MAGHLLKAGHTMFIHTIGKPPADLTDGGATVCATSRARCRAGRHHLHHGAGHAGRAGRPVQRIRRSLRARPRARPSSTAARSTRSPPAASPNRSAALGCDYLDAPVSGGEVGAKAASLTIMVGGEPAAFERIRPLFELMGKNITLVGPAGDGQVCKVANQIIVALNIAAVAEALVFASKAGADPARVRQALMGGFAVVAHPGSTWRAHDQTHIQPGVPDRASSEGSQSRPARRPRAGGGAAADRGRSATDAVLRGPRPRPGRSFRAGARARIDGAAHGDA